MKSESVFLAATDFSPVINPRVAPVTRVFALHTYTAAEGKLAALDTRYRVHTRALFGKYGITDLGYWHPLDADQGAGNTLVYLLAYAKRDAVDALWEKFRFDPDWVRIKAASEKDGKLLAAAVVVFLTPTDFSPMK